MGHRSNLEVGVQRCLPAAFLPWKDRGLRPNRGSVRVCSIWSRYAGRRPRPKAMHTPGVKLCGGSIVQLRTLPWADRLVRVQVVPGGEAEAFAGLAEQAEAAGIGRTLRRIAFSQYHAILPLRATVFQSFNMSIADAGEL